MLHASDDKEAVEVINVHVSMLRHEPVHALVVEDRVSRTDKLVRPSDVVQQLSIVGRSNEARDVWRDRLRAGSG